MVRGLSPTTGTSSVTALKFAHRRGASVKITAANYVVVTGSNGLINPGMMPTSSPWSFTSNLTVSASSTFSGSPFNITGATTTIFSATTTLGRSDAKLGIGTSTPIRNLELVG